MGTWKEDNSLRLVEKTFKPTVANIKELLAGENGDERFLDAAAYLVKDWYTEEYFAFGDYPFDSAEDFYDNAISDIGELYDACDSLDERYIVGLVLGYDTMEDLVEEEGEDYANNLLGEAEKVVAEHSNMH